jgi:hypothetical protein
MTLTTLQRFEFCLRYLTACDQNRSLKLAKFFRDEGYELPVNAKRGDPFHADYHAVNGLVITYKEDREGLTEKIATMKTVVEQRDQPTDPSNDEFRVLFNQLMNLNDEKFKKLIDLVVQTRTALSSLT